MNAPRISSPLLLLALLAAPTLAQVQLAEGQKLTPTQPTFFHSMGTDVALDGSTLAVGAPDSTSSGPGCVYVFEQSAGTWSLDQKIDPPGGSPNGFGFGETVAVQGDTLVAGAGDTAFVYTRGGGGWALQQAIDVSLVDTRSLALDGDTLAVGQYGMTVARVLVWVRSGSSWSIQQVLVGAPGSGFGVAVALSGDSLAVGASFDSQGASNAGAVFYFERSGTQWIELAKLIGAAPFTERRLGGSVDLQAVGGELEILAGGATNSASSAVLFRGAGASFAQTAQLFASTHGASSWFGFDVALDGDRAVVGAWRSDVGGTDRGSATVYRRCGATWQRQADLVASDGSSGDALGRAVAISGETVALGAPAFDGAFAASGQSYAYELGSSPVATYCHGDGSGTACPCGNEIPSGEEGGCRNSSGAGGLLIASDDVQVALDRLRLFACDLLPNQPALLFAGAMPANGGAGFVFGDGLRCASGGVVRLGTAVPNANGDASWGPGLGSVGGWSGGDTRYFQAWYRDPSGSPCAQGFNLSNGVAVTFQP